MAKKKFNATERVRRFVNQNANTKRFSDHQKRNLIRGITKLMTEYRFMGVDMAGGKDSTVVTVYSDGIIKEVLFVDECDVNGAVLNSCHPEYKKGCDLKKRCLRVFPYGLHFRNQVLAKRLGKSVEELTRRDKTVGARKIEVATWEKCRAIRIIANEV